MKPLDSIVRAVFPLIAAFTISASSQDSYNKPYENIKQEHAELISLASYPKEDRETISKGLCQSMLEDLIDLKEYVLEENPFYEEIDLLYGRMEYMSKTTPDLKSVFLYGNWLGDLSRRMQMDKGTYNKIAFCSFLENNFKELNASAEAEAVRKKQYELAKAKPSRYFRSDPFVARQAKIITKGIVSAELYSEKKHINYLKLLDYREKVRGLDTKKVMREVTAYSPINEALHAFLRKIKYLNLQ